MASLIELPQLVSHCKQLPQYKDALPLIIFLQEWGADNDALLEAKAAINEIREHFRMKQPAQNDEQKKLPQIIDTPEIPELKFFHQVKDEDAPLFKATLRECLTMIDLNGKKEWFCLYAAWRYLHRQRKVDGGYVDFFSDIDALFPGLLKDIRADLPGNRRLKPYCDMLSYEYKLWAVDDGKLPEMQVWRHSDWTKKYKNSHEAIKRMQDLVGKFYTAFRSLLYQN